MDVVMTFFSVQEKIYKEIKKKGTMMKDL